jgi:hypothetical protein
MYCVSCEVRTEFICYVEESKSPLLSSGQRSWLQIQRSGFYSRRYQISWEVVGLERGPLSLVSTTEELLWRKSSGSGLESQEYDRRDQSRWPRGTFHPQKLTLISLTSGCRSVGIVRSRTQAAVYILSACHWLCLELHERERESEWDRQHSASAHSGSTLTLREHHITRRGTWFNPLEPSGYYMYLQP